MVQILERVSQERFRECWYVLERPDLIPKSGRPGHEPSGIHSKLVGHILLSMGIE